MSEKITMDQFLSRVTLAEADLIAANQFWHNELDELLTRAEASGLEFARCVIAVSQAIQNVRVAVQKMRPQAAPVVGGDNESA